MHAEYLDVLAAVAVALAAGIAGATVDVRLDAATIAGLDVGDVVTDFEHFDAQFVSWYSRIAVKRHLAEVAGQVGAADADTVDAHERFARGGVTGLQEAGTRALVWGPHDLRQEVTADQAGTLRLPATAHAGVYRLEISNRADRFYAVNLMDRQESDITPLPKVQLTGRVVEAEQSLVQQANVPVWPALILLALVLVVVEWIVYNSKMRI